MGSWWAEVATNPVTSVFLPRRAVGRHWPLLFPWCRWVSRHLPLQSRVEGREPALLTGSLSSLQALMHRVVCQIRALVVLPTKELAQQVHRPPHIPSLS